MIIYCCSHCDGWQPDLFHLRVTEGELVTAIPPFSQVRDWFANVEIENRDWFADVEIVDWTSS